MITRAKLVEQLREHQIRSAQSYSAALAVFSPNPHIASRRDLKVALLYAVLFCFLMVSCYVALYLKWPRLSSIFVFFGILLPDIVCEVSQSLEAVRGFSLVVIFASTVLHFLASCYLKFSVLSGTLFLQSILLAGCFSVVSSMLSSDDLVKVATG